MQSTIRHFSIVWFLVIVTDGNLSGKIQLVTSLKITKMLQIKIHIFKKQTKIEIEKDYQFMELKL